MRSPDFTSFPEDASTTASLLFELAQSIDEGLWIFDLARQEFCYVSPAYIEIFGVSHGRSRSEWLTHVCEEDLPLVLESLEMQRNGKPTVNEYRIARLDGQHRWVVDRSFPVFTSEGRLIRTVGTLRDVSDRVVAQEKVASQRADFFHASRLTTLGLMSAALSHELNQPLSAIANYASACEAILKMQNDQSLEPIRDFVRRIVEQSLRAGEIIQRHREFSRKSPGRNSKIDLNVLLKDTERLMSVDLRWRGVQLRWELASELPSFIGDAIQLQQVFVNLINNAADAMQQLEPARRIIVFRTSIDDNKVIAEVEDQGSGIPESVMARLFEPFVSSKEHGSGIGLSICRSILRAHHGEIDAIRLDPCGTRFLVRFPIQKDS